MPIDVTMPKLSDTMEEGKILKWLPRAFEPLEDLALLHGVGELRHGDVDRHAHPQGTTRPAPVQPPRRGSGTGLRQPRARANVPRRRSAGAGASSPLRFGAGERWA